MKDVLRLTALMPLILVILTIVNGCSSGAEVTSDSGLKCRGFDIPEAQSLFSGNRYSRIDRVSDIPKPVREAVLDELRWTEHLWASIQEIIANPGDCYNPTDDMRAGFPSRRLILGGASEERVFLYYEHGGYVTHTHLAVFEVKRNKALIILLQMDEPYDLKTLDLERNLTATGEDSETSVHQEDKVVGHL